MFPSFFFFGFVLTGPVFAGDFLGGSAPAATLPLSLQDYSAGVLPRTRRGHDDVVELGAE